MVGDQWPIFLYKNYKYERALPWKGLLKSEILVRVSMSIFSYLHHPLMTLQAYKYIFTSPSSVLQEATSTRSGNARIHGMTEITLASIAYIATQVSSRPQLYLVLFINIANTGPICAVLDICIL